MAIRAWTSARWSIPLPPDHRFPIAKYALIRDGILGRGVLPPSAMVEPDPVDVAALRLVHTAEYVDRIRHASLPEREARRIGFPTCPELWERSARSTQGTLEAMHDALAEGVGINLSGGTHHAYPDHGEGYCVFNDVAIGLRSLQMMGNLRRAAIVDLDVHQGNGTAAIFADDPDVFTFSMHGANNYPFRKERSSLDVECADGMGDAEYLALLERYLGEVLDAARPDIVVYLGGADPYAGDRLGRLQLSIEGLARRDRMVFTACRQRRLPVAMVLSGGYARDLADVVTIHTNTVDELRRALS